MASYPPAPWRLRGWGIQTLHAIPIELARRLAQPKPPIIPIWPGHTLATVLFASYEDGALTYHELLIGVGLFSLRGPRWCIPRLWVDSELSVAGGREIWKLPKQLATFEGRHSMREAHVHVHGVCRIDTKGRRHTIPLWLPARAFGQTTEAYFPFNASMRARASLAHVNLTWLDPNLAAMKLNRPIISLHYESLDVVIHPAADGVRRFGRL